MAIEAHQLLSFTFSGLANSVLLVSIAESSNNAFLALALSGILGYGIMELTRRIYYRLLTPDANPLTNKLGLFRIENWDRLIVWGLVNGILFTLLYPYFATSYVLLYLMGVITVHIRDIYNFVYRAVVKQRAVGAVTSAAQVIGSQRQRR